jgi:hypothetical protein
MDSPKLVALKLSPDILRSIAAREDGGNRTEWIKEAINQRLSRLKVADQDREVFAGLEAEDVRRVKRYIKVLRDSRGNGLFRAAVDANFNWLASTLPNAK